MRPGIGEERGMLLGRNPRGQGFQQLKDTGAGSRETDQSCDQRHEIHGREEFADGNDQLAGPEFWTPAGACGHREAKAEWESDPPGGDDTPKQSQHGRGIGIDQPEVADGKILDANAGGNLVVDDPVQNRRRDRECDDGEGLHGIRLVGG